MRTISGVLAVAAVLSIQGCAGRSGLAGHKPPMVVPSSGMVMLVPAETPPDGQCFYFPSSNRLAMIVVRDGKLAYPPYRRTLPANDEQNPFVIKARRQEAKRQDSGALRLSCVKAPRGAALAPLFRP